MYRNIAVLCIAVALTNCRVGPNYRRPDVPTPPQFRGGEPNPSKASLGDVSWFDLFQDDTLRVLIRDALRSNYDIRIAAQRILAAQGQVTVVRSAQFPRVDAQGDAYRTGINNPIDSTRNIFAIATWELDLFGKLRRATEAARADLLAIEENRQTIWESIIAQVAAAYFDLCEYDAELEIVRESIKSRQQSLDLVQAREKGGVASMLDVDQAKSLVESARSDAIRLERGQEETENLISILLGKPPGPIARGRKLTDQPQPPEVPAGLPSALLERRPDLRAAEEQLVAANARVGVAKAAYFPSINLTAAGGYQTTDLLGIAFRSGPAYTVAGLVDVPIFDAGRRGGNYKTAKAQREEMVLQYLSAINGAFRDVSDALIGHQKTKEYAASQLAFTETLRDQSRLANERYAGGVTSYLEVLDTERERLRGEQALTQAQRDVLITLVQLYRALGGGWR
ncbi:MAG TPA: efflux transporter outer membrane subunit [Candidatus Solibacter sp.]|nr:efflux transporter outer membrane subunit [Candidatus Solibacter sp.]